MGEIYLQNRGETEVKTKTVKKALDVLDCFLYENAELGVTEISKLTGLYKSNVCNILSTYVQCGYLEKNPVNEKYHIGLKFMKLANKLMINIGANGMIHKVINQLAEELNERVYYAVPYKHEVMYINVAFPKWENFRWIVSGTTAPMYCTGLGKAMLAYLPQEQKNEVLSLPMQSFTEHTITDPAKLLAELEVVRQRGYAIDNGEHKSHGKCVAVPVFSQNGELYGAISVTGRAKRLDDETCKKFALVLLEKAEQLKLYI